jgi:hypothetical protein
MPSATQTQKATPTTLVIARIHTCAPFFLRAPRLLHQFDGLDYERTKAAALARGNTEVNQILPPDLARRA